MSTLAELLLVLLMALAYSGVMWLAVYLTRPPKPLKD